MYHFDVRSKINLKLIIFVGIVYILSAYLDLSMYNFGIGLNGTATVHNYNERVTDNAGIANERVYKNDFQSAADDSAILVYSAYLEDRPSRLRVIGITSRRNNTQVNCILRYKHGNQPVTIQGYILHIPDSHNARYVAMFILCDLSETEEPDTVSIVEKSSERGARNILTVVRISLQPTRHVFSACVSPMHSNFSDTAQLTEWVEMNRILGIEKFTIYINSVSKHVHKVLKYYEHKGLVTLLPWTLPHKLTGRSLLHYNGQLAALNDCLYRSKGKSLYLSSTDLDEFIIPQKRNHITWSDMLSSLPSQSVYIIRCSFFSQKRSCSKKKRCSGRLTIDSYKVRDDIILESHKRSKYIAKTSDVITMGIHFTWDLHTGSEYTVNPDTALLHHYRKDKKHYTKAAYTKIPHKTAGKYSINLHKNLKNMITEFNKFSNVLVHK